MRIERKKRRWEGYKKCIGSFQERLVEAQTNSVSVGKMAGQYQSRHKEYRHVAESQRGENSQELQQLPGLEVHEMVIWFLLCCLLLPSVGLFWTPSHRGRSPFATGQPLFLPDDDPRSNKKSRLQFQATPIDFLKGFSLVICFASRPR